MMRWACLTSWYNSLRTPLPTIYLILHLILYVSSLTMAASGESLAFPPSMRHRLQVHQARQQARWHAAQAIKQQWQAAPQWTPSQQCEVDSKGKMVCTQLGVRAAHWPGHGLSFCVKCKDPLHQGAFGTCLTERLVAASAAAGLSHSRTAVTACCKLPQLPSGMQRMLSKRLPQ